jgi:hypothetical protein
MSRGLIEAGPPIQAAVTAMSAGPSRKPAGRHREVHSAPQSASASGAGLRAVARAGDCTCTFHYVCVRFATEKQSSNGRAARRRDRVPHAGIPTSGKR